MIWILDINWWRLSWSLLHRVGGRHLGSYFADKEEERIVREEGILEVARGKIRLKYPCACLWTNNCFFSTWIPLFAGTANFYTKHELNGATQPTCRPQVWMEKDFEPCLVRFDTKNSWGSFRWFFLSSLGFTKPSQRCDVDGVTDRLRRAKFLFSFALKSFLYF